MYFCPVVLSFLFLKSPPNSQLEFKQLVTSLSDGERLFYQDKIAIETKRSTY